MLHSPILWESLVFTMVYTAGLFAGILYSEILVPLPVLSPLLIFVQKGRWTYVICLDCCSRRPLHPWIYSLVLCPSLMLSCSGQGEITPYTLTGPKKLRLLISRLHIVAFHLLHHFQDIDRWNSYLYRSQNLQAAQTKGPLILTAS